MKQTAARTSRIERLVDDYIMELNAGCHFAIVRGCSTMRRKNISGPSAVKISFSPAVASAAAGLETAQKAVSSNPLTVPLEII
jgi:hypothetical protein